LGAADVDGGGPLHRLKTTAWRKEEEMFANEIIYNSSLHVREPADLATFAVFYEKVWLPYVPTSKIKLVEFIRQEGIWKLESIHMWLHSFIDQDGKKWEVDRFTNDWNERHDSLFEAGVLQRLAAPATDMMGELFGGKDQDSGRAFNSAFEPVQNLIDDIPMALKTSLMDSNERKEVRYLWQDHLLHLLRKDIDKPAIFLLGNRRDRRELSKAILADAMFSYCVPRLGELHPDEMLEVRRLTADNREGFGAHIQQLSGNLDSLVRSGAKLAEIRDAANDVIETKLLPDYAEFKRQLVATRLTGARKILDPASKILEIDSSPITPKFWYDLIKAGYLAATGASEVGKEDHTNKAMAFNLIRRVDERSSHLLAKRGRRSHSLLR
jgi:hypothetical protein